MVIVFRVYDKSILDPGNIEQAIDHITKEVITEQEEFFMQDQENFEVCLEHGYSISPETREIFPELKQQIIEFLTKEDNSQSVDDIQYIDYFHGFYSGNNTFGWWIYKILKFLFDSGYNIKYLEIDDGNDNNYVLVLVK